MKKVPVSFNLNQETHKKLKMEAIERDVPLKQHFNDILNKSAVDIPINKSKLKKSIKNFSDNGEWWKRDNETAFFKSAIELIKNGYSQEDAVDFLEDLYSCFAGEFGN